jgi:hypothetical protein
MNHLELNRVSKEIIQHAEDALISQQALPRAVDDYFVQRLKQDEMDHASVDPRLYEGLRKLVKAQVLPLYEQYRLETTRLREQKQKRKIWKFVLGTVIVCEFVEALLTRGRSIKPQILIPSALLYTFIGFIIYVATQYVDDLKLQRARKRLERSIANLQNHVDVDVEYDQRRELIDDDVLRAEALEILAKYDQPADFWRDYRRVRRADPTLPSELKTLNLPAFERFLRFHVENELSSVARQQRFNRLFIQAHEVFLSRDREHYALNHLKTSA